MDEIKMIEANIIFKEGINTHLTLNATFEDIGKEIETNSKLGFIEFNEFHERIPSYMHILGKLLMNRAESFWDAEENTDKEITKLKHWIPEEEEEKKTYEEKDEEKDE